jgi:hypothetical protein
MEKLAEMNYKTISREMQLLMMLIMFKLLVIQLISFDISKDY